MEKDYICDNACASQKLVPYICNILSSLFYLRRWIIRCPCTFALVRHTRPTFHVDWFTFQPRNFVVAFFSRVALWACRAEVCVFFAFDTSRDCRKSDCPTNLSDWPTNYLFAVLNIWLIDYVSLWSTCWATALRGLHGLRCGFYINSELCVLKRVDSISESPGSVRQLNESRFGRNNTCKPILELHLAKGTTLEICSNLCELEALLTRYNNKNKMTSIIRG